MSEKSRFYICWHANLQSILVHWIFFPQIGFAKPTRPWRPCKATEQNFKCTWPAFVGCTIGTCVSSCKKLLCCTRSSLKYFSTGSCASEFPWITSAIFLWAVAAQQTTGGAGGARFNMTSFVVAAWIDAVLMRGGFFEGDWAASLKATTDRQNSCIASSNITEFSTWETDLKSLNPLGFVHNNGSKFV